MSHYLALELESNDIIKATEFDRLLVSYIQDKVRLSTLIDDLKKYQDNLPEDKLIAVGIILTEVLQGFKGDKRV